MDTSKMLVTLVKFAVQLVLLVPTINANVSFVLLTENKNQKTVVHV